MEWYELLDDTAAFLRFHYEEIQEHGSDELKKAAEIVLNGHPPEIHHKKEA